MAMSPRPYCSDICRQQASLIKRIRELLSGRPTMRCLGLFVAEVDCCEELRTIRVATRESSKRL